MKILVIGSNGMAGHIVVSYLKKRGHLVTTMARSHADYCLDIEDVTQTQHIFSIIENYSWYKKPM